MAGLAGLALPLLGLGGFQLQVGIDALVIALLAVGLNIVVGWAGLLDLGYVAFFGFGAYGYALLSSSQLGANGIHLPYWLSLPIVMIGAALLGLAVGLPSRRLLGDYLAIVTLFLGEAFVEFTNNVAPSKLGGPNGITAIDPIRSFGVVLTTNESYYFLLVIVVVVTMAVLRLLEYSRTGRAWRAVREDPLAAAAMTIPVNRVKLSAFACGAMVAALAGTIFAAQQASVFPTDFDTPILILIYAGLILGGTGSIAGAATGALVVMVIYDGLLRSPAEASLLFYGLGLLTLLVKLRPWRRLAAVLGATVALGFAAHAIAAAISPSAVAGGPQSTGLIGDGLRDWIIVPANPRADRGERRVRGADLPGDHAGAGQGQVADHPAGADDLPGRVRMGDQAGERAIDYPAADDRCDPHRDDDQPARRGCSGSDGSRSRMSAGPERRGRAPVLELDQLSLSFGGLRALSELDLQVGEREVVSVIGPNGAGKTTVFNVITGVYEPSAGDVRFAAQPGSAESIAGRPPHVIARLGVARTFQTLRLFMNMSVLENVMAATYGGTKAMPWESVLRLPRARREEREARALAEDVLSFFGQRLAGYRWDQPAYSLSYANRRRLEIARALATKPKLLLLDEPAAGMNPAETHEITELIGRLCDEREVAILVIEHDMHVVSGCSDRVVALDHGVKIAEGSFDAVSNHPAVVEAYMGRHPEDLAGAE